MICLAIFDLDGTIVRSFYNWKEIRKILDIDPEEEILNAIYSLSEAERNQKLALLEAIETANSNKTYPFKNVLDFIDYFHQIGVATALITNNSLKNTIKIINRYGFKFDEIITRDLNVWKPSAEPILMLLRKTGININETIFFGDSRYDIIAAKKSGITKIFIRGQRNKFLNRIAAESLKDICFFNSYRKLLIKFSSMSACRHRKLTDQ